MCATISTRAAKERRVSHTTGLDSALTGLTSAIGLTLPQYPAVGAGKVFQSGPQSFHSDNTVRVPLGT